VRLGVAEAGAVKAGEAVEQREGGKLGKGVTLSKMHGVALGLEEVEAE
jgi:hypothetical protein